MPPSLEAAHVLERLPEYLRNARITGIKDIDRVRAHVAHENQRENPREDVLERLAGQASAIRDRTEHPTYR